MQTSPTDLQHLTRSEGRIAYSVAGSGPLVVLAPGMGDTRDVYRALAPRLVDAGYRVAVTDVRGHGDSDADFARTGDSATAEDLGALIEELGAPAVLVGNSFAGSAAVIAAAEQPEAVAGLVLLSPFLRESSSPTARAFTRILFRILFARPWGAAMWASYYRGTLNRGHRAPWLDEHVAELRTRLRNPRRLAAFRRLAVGLDHEEVEPFVDRVAAPALIIVGALDPDYSDPAAELRLMGERLGAETLLVPEAAHYAHAQRPDLVDPRIVGFLDGLRSTTAWGARA